MTESIRHDEKRTVHKGRVVVRDAPLRYAGDDICTNGYCDSEDAESGRCADGECALMVALTGSRDGGR